jgi:hypothetical protein
MPHGFPLIAGVLFFSACATITLPVSVTMPPAVDLGSYRQFAFGEMDGSSGPQFKAILQAGLSRSPIFYFIPSDRLEVFAAEYDLAKANPQLDSKTEDLEIELSGSAFISGVINKDYYEVVRERPDVCVLKNQKHPCPLKTRVGDIRISGHIDFTDARTGKLIRSQGISNVCELQTWAKNAVPGPINQGQLERQCVNVAARDLLFLLLPSQKLFFPSFVKVPEIPNANLGMVDAEAGRMMEASHDFEKGLQSPEAQKAGFDRKLLSDLYWNAGLAQEYSWQFDQALASFKKAYALVPDINILVEESQLLNLEAERRKLLGVTPLMLAAEGGAWIQVQGLLQKGVDPNLQDSSGNTALMGAVRKGDVRIVKILLGNGAFVDIKNNRGLSVLDMTKNLQIIALLKGPTSVSEPVNGRSQFPKVVQVIHSDVDKPDYHLPQDPRKFALVVGIEYYGNDLPPAEFADHDAEVMRNHLIALGYAPRHIHWLKDVEGTHAAFVKNLEGWLPQVTDSSSTVFFYYSGHGAADPETRKVYLVPADGDPNYLEETAYPLSDLYDELGSLPAKRVIVALDSCFSGRGSRSLAPQGARPLVTVASVAPSSSGRLAVMTASSGSQIAEVLNSEGHGLFTYYFLKGLNGVAMTPVKDITFQSLYNYLKPQVEDAAGLKNHSQTPEFLPQGLLKSAPILLR